MSIKVVVITLVLLLTVALLAYFFWPHEKNITNYPSSGVDIIAYGDSLVSGSGSTKGKDFVSLLSQKLGTEIINLGVPGDTTHDGLERIEVLDRYKPKVVMLLLGGNDALTRVPSEQTFANLSRIIENIHQRGAVVVLLGIRGGALSDPYSSEFAALAKKYKTAYVPDVLAGLLGDATYMADRIHPNDLGYQKIADRVYPVLKAVTAK